MAVRHGNPVIPEQAAGWPWQPTCDSMAGRQWLKSLTEGGGQWQYRIINILWLVTAQSGRLDMAA